MLPHCGLYFQSPSGIHSTSSLQSRSRWLHCSSQHAATLVGCHSRDTRGFVECSSVKAAMRCSGLRIISQCSPRILGGAFRPSSRALSSSRPPSILDGFDGRRAFVDRCVERADEIIRYRQRGLFAPFPLAWSDYVLFAKLQQPTSTHIDLEDFISGARDAYDFAIRTMFSPELMKFAIGEGEKTEAIARLEHAMWPNCFYPHVHNIRSVKDHLKRMELRDVTIKNASLVDVKWDRLRLSAVREEEQFAYEATQDFLKRRRDDESNNGSAAAFKAGSGAFDADRAEALDNQLFPSKPPTASTSDLKDDPLVERLRLDVYFETVEHLMGETSDSDGVEILVRDVDSVVQFGSLVTSPDDLDWRIVRFKESSSEVIERSTE